MKESFDLTTNEGIEQARSVAKNLGTAILLSNPLFAIANASMRIAKGMTKTNSIETQAQAAVDIIKAGKENGAKRVKVTLSQEAGANLSVPIEGVNVSAKVGSNGKMTLEVEY